MIKVNSLKKHLILATDCVHLANFVVNYDCNVQLIALNLWKLYLIDTGKYKPLLTDDVIMYADGVFCKLFFGFKLKTIPGADLWIEILQQLHENGKPQEVLVIGGSEVVNVDSVEKLRVQFPLFKFTGLDGYQDSKLYFDAAANVKPSIVFVAMGSPKQELIIQRICYENNVRVAMGLGGSLDVFTGYKKRVHKFWRGLHLEGFVRTITSLSKLSARREAIIWAISKMFKLR